MTRDMGPHSRCSGPEVPPPQPFQRPLPPVDAASSPVDYTAVRASIDGLLTSGAVLGVDLVKLAWQCASTFRVTDYTGGCNGARVLQQPQSSWAGNAGLGAVKQQLSVVKAAHGRALSWADLIVLAGNTALEAMGGQSVPFCPGRTDASAADEEAAQTPPPPMDSVAALREASHRMGLSLRELVVLLGRPMAERGSERLTHRVYSTLLSGAASSAVPTDGMLNADPELQAIAQSYASDGELFHKEMALAWAKLMNADRFDGSAANLCVPDCPDGGGEGGGEASAASGAASTATLEATLALRGEIGSVVTVTTVLAVLVAVLLVLMASMACKRAQVQPFGSKEVQHASDL